MRPSRSPSALPVDSPWRTRISTAVRPGIAGHRPRSHHVDQDPVALGAGGERVGRQVVDPLDLDRGQGQVAAVAPVADEPGRPDPAEVGAQSLVALGQVGRQAGGRLGPGRRPRTRWPPGARPRTRPPPRSGAPPRPRARPPVARWAASASSSGSSSSIRTSSSSSSVRWRSASWLTSWSMAWRSFEADHRAGAHPRLELVATLGRRGDPLLQGGLSAGQVVHLRPGPRPSPRPGRAWRSRTPARAIRSGMASMRCRSWSSAVSCSWTCIKVSYGSAIGLLGRPPGPVSGTRWRSAYGLTGAPRRVRRRRAPSASSQGNQRTSWLSPGGGAGSAIGADEQVPDVEVDVVVGGAVHVDMDQDRSAVGMAQRRDRSPPGSPGAHPPRATRRDRGGHRVGATGGAVGAGGAARPAARPRRPTP